MKAATDTNNKFDKTTRISIHAAREGGDTEYNLPKLEGTISIHAAREGGDRVLSTFRHHRKISIHAAREGGDRHRVHHLLVRW